METKTVKQTVTFKASPHDVYEALMDSKKVAGKIIRGISSTPKSPLSC